MRAFVSQPLVRYVAESTEMDMTFEVLAVLRPEPKNPHDKNAVAVQVQGKQVGYLPKAMASRLHKPLVALERSGGKPIGCRARIVGGWKRGRTDQGHFGIRLFFELDEILQGTAKQR